MTIPPAPRLTGLRGVLDRVGGVLRRILGAPDYAGYVAHVARAHPGVEPIPEKEFIRRQLEGRGKPGARCC